MNAGLPERIDPREAAKAGLRWTGRIPLSALGRLAADPADGEGQVAVTLHASLDEAGLAVLGGQVSARVRVLCQRCLEPMVVDLAADLALVAVAEAVAEDAQADALPEHYEPLELPHGASVLVTDLVEDELLLAMPPYPRHSPAQCAATDVLAAQARPRAFSMLATLKTGAARTGTKENS